MSGNDGSVLTDAVGAIGRRRDAIVRALNERGIDPVAATVGAIVALGLLARLLFLGSRLAHFDEGRVGYWVLHFMETGEFHYRFIIHGPFVQHVNSVVFAAFGSNDFTMRLVVAFIGAAIPLPVLLLREHLRDSEVVAAAAFLAFNPVLLYYSRFFRSTIPVAAFCFAAFACLVQYYDTRRPRFVHAAVALFALGFTAKENAAVYLLVFAGSGALLLDYELFRPRKARNGLSWLGSWWTRSVVSRDLRAAIPRLLGHVAFSAVLFGAIVLFFYAPRSGSTGGVGLYGALTSPGSFPALIDVTVADIAEGYTWWFTDAGQTTSEVPVLEQYANFLERTLNVLSTYAAPLVALAVLGFLAERYASVRRRNVVMFTGYWGFVSVLGYPLGADIFGAWITVNMLVPLAIPAGVAAALLYRWGRDAYTDNDELSLGIVGLLALLVLAQGLGTAVAGVYVNPQSDANGLVQFGQPADPELRDTLRDVEALADATSGTDVLFYGDRLIDDGDEGIEPACADIGETLPLQWYLTRYDAEAACLETNASIGARFPESPPPVVIAYGTESDPVAEQLPGYERRFHLIHTSGVQLAFFVDDERLAQTVELSSRSPVRLGTQARFRVRGLLEADAAPKR